MATKKAKVTRDYSDPLYIGNECAAIDRKDYDYYDKLTPEQQKKFSPYLLLRWGSCVEGGNDIAKYYAVAMNEFANQNFWDLSKHKKLQWLLVCTASPGIGKQKHYWLGAAQREKSNALRNLMQEQFPTMKLHDIDLMLELNSPEEILLWLEQLGMDATSLTKLLK